LKLHFWYCQLGHVTLCISHKQLPIFLGIYVIMITVKGVVYGIIVYSECQDALGMENGLISDAQLSASSQWNDLEGAHRGRLHLTEVWDPLHQSGGWVSKINDVNQWLQIDVLGLTRNYVRVTRVSTQGRETTSYGELYVKTYKLQYSNDGVNFQYYKESGTANAKVTRHFTMESEDNAFTILHKSFLFLSKLCAIATKRYSYLLYKHQ